MARNYFRDFLSRTDGRTMVKMDHYLDVYHRLLGAAEGRDVRFLEIGVFKGGSIPMWKGFWGPNAQLTFVDIDEACRRFAEDRVTVEIGDQEDRDFMAGLGERHGPFNVIVDDGGHMMSQQIASFEALWPYLADGGVYIIEDTHTSYWPGFGGGFRAEGSLMEYAKGLIDRMHSWYTDQDDIFPLDPIARDLSSVHIFDSMVVIEKRRADPPEWIFAENGKVTRSRRGLEVRGRKSIFPRTRAD